LIKIIGGGNPLGEKVTSFYSQLNVLRLPDVYKFEVGKLFYARFQNKIPNKLSNLFSYSYNTDSMFLVGNTVGVV